MRGVNNNFEYFKTLEAKQAANLSPAAGKQAASRAENGFFGEDGPGFRDILDGINPLNHIPIVSEMLESETGHKVSTASKLIGGALLGGPVGLFAAVIDSVFEQATGKSAVGTMIAALSGDETGAGSGTMLAANEIKDEAAPTQLAQNTQFAVPVDEVEVADQAQAAIAKATAKIKENAPAPLHVADIRTDQAARDQALLALYGSSAPSAHNSYKKAQMLSYLRDVNTSHVL